MPQVYNRSRLDHIRRPVSFCFLKSIQTEIVLEEKII